MSDIFNKDQAKRLFATIAAGASAGALLGPLVPTLFAERIGIYTLILVAAALLSVTIPLIFVLAKLKHTALENNNQHNNTKDYKIGGNPLNGFKSFATNPYLLAIGAFILLYTMISTFVYFEQKNLVKAEEYINKALNIDNNNPKYWKNAAVIYIENKDWHQADFAFRRCIDLGDFEKDNWFKWVLVLLHLKDYYEVLSVLDRAIDLYPDQADFIYLQAGVLSKTGHITKSKITFEKAWKIDPQKKSIVLEYFPEILNNAWAQPYFIPFDNSHQ